MLSKRPLLKGLLLLLFLFQRHVVLLWLRSRDANAFPAASLKVDRVRAAFFDIASLAERRSTTGDSPTFADIFLLVEREILAIFVLDSFAAQKLQHERKK